MTDYEFLILLQNKLEHNIEVADTNAHKARTDEGYWGWACSRGAFESVKKMVDDYLDSKEEEDN